MKLTIVTNSQTIEWTASDEHSAMCLVSFRDNYLAWLAGNHPNPGADFNLSDGRTVPIEYRDVIRVDIEEDR